VKVFFYSLTPIFVVFKKMNLSFKHYRQQSMGKLYFVIF